jgi:DNA-binding response OmpR family regulator
VFLFSKKGPEQVIRVLQVDDEINHLIISERFLKKFDANFEVEVATSPEEALKKLKNEPFDCLVADYRMPRMDGIELAKKVRKTMDIPIIIYTGHGSEEIASAAFKAGIDDYLKKEFDKSHYEILAKRIKMVVEKKEAEKAQHLLEQQDQLILKILQIINRIEDNKQAFMEVVSAIS